MPNRNDTLTPNRLTQSIGGFAAVLNAMHEWMVIVDAQARIVFINRPYARFLKVDSQKVLGQPVTEVIENTRMHRVVASGKAELTQLHAIRGNQMIANRYPVFAAGKVIGAVGTVAFHDTHEWKQINSQIRALIAERDYQAKDLTPAPTDGSPAHFHLNDVVGKSPAIQLLNEQVKRIAGGDVSVLIRGESGTGKELYAHAIHQLSDRADGPFIKLNCAAIPEHLLESELFGYETGAFTGARKGGKPGKFQLADGGTLFLDEIGDMPLAMQAKLLRFLQDRQLEAVGSTRTSPIDLRLITATHQPLETRLAEGEFREDLYYRINVVQLALPPLRERPEDIPALVEHHLQKLALRTGRRAPKMTAEALTQLMAYTWPGNIRELQNALEAAFHLGQGRKISAQALPKAIADVDTRPNTPITLGSSDTLKEQVAQAERQILQDALRACGGNRLQTARHLAVSKSTLYEKLERYGL